MNNITQDQALLLADYYSDQNYEKLCIHLTEQLTQIGFFVDEASNNDQSNVFSAMLSGLRIWFPPEMDCNKQDIEESAYDVLKAHYPNLEFEFLGSDIAPAYVEIKLKNTQNTLV